MRIMLLLAGAAALSACASTAPTGSGWSRAPDLSVYSSMNHFAALAREQAVLCAGRTPESVDRQWQRHYAARHDRVSSAMVSRYGAEAVEEAREPPGRAVPCRTIASPVWWDNYERLLRLLELRFSEGSAG